MKEEEIEELSKYLLNRPRLLDKDLLPFGDPGGKDVLIFGCGLGAEVPWCAQRHAKSVVGIDLKPIHPEPLARAMQTSGLAGTKYELRMQNVHDLALGDERFDLILSNGVFEHIGDLKGVLESFRPLLRPRGRIAIFADGLWYSSIGGHIRRFAWE